MITQYTLRLIADRTDRLRPETAYRLYACLLREAGGSFGRDAHEGAVTPVSQHLLLSSGGPVWTVTLLGAQAEDALAPALDGLRELYVEADRTTLTVADRRVRRLSGAEELFAMTEPPTARRTLRIVTPAVFRSRGEYLCYPTPRLILQSLIKKWNGSFPECPIEDEDGEGLEALAAGLRIDGFQLRSAAYHLKGSRIPGFTGELRLDNRLEGFHRQITDALLVFASYAGVGAKTTLGMGGVRLGERQKR